MAAFLHPRTLVLAGFLLASLMLTPSARPSYGAELDMEGLKDKLEAFADEIHANENADGETANYDIVIKKGTWRFVITAYINGDKITMLARLGEVPDPLTAPSPILLKLLKANDTIYPACFTYAEKQKRFYLIAEIDSAAKTREIGRLLDRMTDSIENYAPLWNPERWADAGK